MSKLTPSLRFDFTSTYATKSNSGSDLIKVEDISKNGYDATVHTGCTIINDLIMGPCMSFDGTDGYVTIPALTSPGNGNFSQGLTICAWVNFASFGTGTSIIDLGKYGGKDNLILQLSGTEGAFQLVHIRTDGTDHAVTLPTPSQEHLKKNVNVLETGKWAHIAVTVGSTGIGRIYINGTRVYKTPDASTKRLPSEKLTTFNNYVGNSNWNTSTVNRFQGKMAWVSLYNRRLKTDQVQEDMVQGELNRAATFNKSLPLDFQLYSKGSKDDAPVLYIEQAGDGKDLDLIITNNTSSAIDIKSDAVTGPVSGSQYHFQLQFRTGTLATSLFGTAQIIGDWSIYINSGNGIEYISLLCTSGSPSIPKDNGQLLISLPKVKANPQGGARNANVTLLYHKIGNNNDLKGQRLQSLSIVNHTGQKYIPLHVDVVGAPQVLNDGSSENNLLFRIENIGSEPIPLSKTASDTTQKSFFEVGVMVQPLDELMEWALVKQGDVSSLALDWPVIGVVASSTPSIITLEEPLAASLASGSQVVIKPKTGTASTYSLNAKADAGQREIEITSTAGIDGGSIISLSNQLGTLQASTGTTLTPNTALPLTSTSSVNLTITPPADIIAKAESLSGSTLTLKGNYSLPAGRKVYLVNPVGRAKTSVEKATQISLVTPRSKSLVIGSTLNITTPIGGEHTAEATGLSGDGATLTISTPLTIPQGSDLSQLQLLGTVKTATSDSATIKLANAASEATVSNGSLIIIKPASDTVISVASSQAITEGSTSLNIATAETIQEGSTLSLNTSTPPWNVIENSLVTTAISGLQQWTITNEQVEEIVSGGGIEFLLRDIICGLPAGQSLITIRYYNIPGYWDGKFVVPIQKGPIISTKQNVGIGVSSDANATLNLAYPNTGKEALLIGPPNTNDGTSTTTADAIKVLDASASEQLRIKQDGSIHTKGNIKTKGTLTVTGDIHMISSAGKLGINTTSPSCALDVFGKIRSETLHVYGEIKGTSLDVGTGSIDGGNLDIDDHTKLSYIHHNYQNLPKKNKGLAIAYNYESGQSEIDFFNTTTKLHGDNSKYKDSHDAFHFYQMTSENSADRLMYITKAGDVRAIGSIWGLAFYTPGNTSTDTLSASGNIVTSGGNIGIGTQVPDYPLHLFGGSGLSYDDSGHYFATKPLLPGHRSSLSQIGAHIRNNVVSQSFYSTTTGNEDVVLSSNEANNQKDLKVLKKLKISDFRHKGGETVDNRVRKGLDGYELEKVLPGAVIHHSDFVRNIYALAKKVKPHKKKHQLTIYLEKNHKLKVGDTLELVTDSNQRLEKKVVAAPGPKEVVVGNWTEQTKKLFVYGKKVDDLRAIDYHQVAMLGVSATQQLHKELEESKADNAALKKRCSQLEKRAEKQHEQHKRDMASLQKELKAIKKLIAKHSI